MKKEIESRKPEVESRKIFFVFCLLFSVFCLSACSIPNLESTECIEARNSVKEFYSYHLGNDMKPSLENLKRRERFLSKDLRQTLSASAETQKDYFTATDDYPKAFRAGKCEKLSPQKTVFEILLFWKTETREEQREIKVETVKEGDQWLIDKVENK